jgi:hypothetical protein
MEVEGLREELTVAEQKLRDANEMELPEEQYRVVVDGKRTELKELMETFTKLNLETPSKFADSTSTHHNNKAGEETSGETGARPKFERPSERRKRLEEQHGGDGGGGYGDGRGGGDNNDEDNAFSSFQGNRGRNRSDSGSGGKGRYHGRGSDQFHD